MLHFSRYPKKMNYFRGVYSLLALTVYVHGNYDPSVSIIDVVSLCICNGKYSRNVHPQVPKHCVLNLTNIFLKIPKDSVLNLTYLT